MAAPGKTTPFQEASLLKADYHGLCLFLFPQIKITMHRHFGLGSNIGRGLFVGWVEHPNIFCWVSFLYPTYLPTIFVLSAKPNKMAEDRIIPDILIIQRTTLTYWGSAQLTSNDD